MKILKGIIVVGGLTATYVIGYVHGAKRLSAYIIQGLNEDIPKIPGTERKWGAK